MLGDRIKTLRQEKKITQADLAKLLNISPSTIGMWEQNRRSPDNEALKKIADFFEVSVDYLLERYESAYYNSFPERLKYERLDKKLSQQELADSLFLDRTSISKYETGKQIPETPVLEKLAEFFGVSIDYLLAKNNIRNYESLNSDLDIEINIPKEYADKYKVSSRDKKQYLEEMKKANEAFFMNDEFNEEAKKEMLDLMAELFWDAKAKNKRKK